MEYCKTASRLLKKKVVCGAGCPIVKKCPRLILENAADEAVEQAIEAMLEAISEKR